MSRQSSSYCVARGLDRPCPVCGGGAFAFSRILWPELVAAWELNPCEVDYIDRQQGLRCRGCDNPLRAMALAAAILEAHPLAATLDALCRSGTDLRVLEINQAAMLTPFLRLLDHHRLVEHPEFDMTRLALDSGAFDLVIHSDTLEHVTDPLRALSECRRVLRDGGACIFTVPVVVGRPTRSRRGLPASYHGFPGTPATDQLVHSEFGLDVSGLVLEAGFSSCRISALEYPAALAITAAR